MNSFVGSGRITHVSKPITLTTGKKVIKFTVTTANGFNEEETKKVDYIPCSVFEPSEEFENLLSSEPEQHFIEFQGKVKTFSVDEPPGKKVYKTEVSVNSRSIKFID